MPTVVSFQHLQFPLVYAARCKRKDQAGQPFLRDNADDLIVMLLAFALFSPSPGLATLSIICLHASFWAIYEAGYFQNDLVAVRHEVDPKVPQAFEEFRHRYSELRAWLWASLFAVAGAGLATVAAGLAAVDPPAAGGQVLAASSTFSPGTALAAAGIWIGLLGLLRATFHLYNQVDKMSRVYLYLPLQVLKYGLPAAFFTLTPAGAALLAAQILRRWLPYLQYRLTGMKKDVFPARIVRLMIFVIVWLLLLPSEEVTGFFVEGGVIAAFLVLRAWSQIRSLLHQVRWVQDDIWKGAAQDERGVQTLRLNESGYQGDNEKSASILR